MPTHNFALAEHPQAAYFFRECSGLEYSQENVYNQMRDRTLELQEFLESKLQTKNFPKTRETKEQG